MGRGQFAKMRRAFTRDEDGSLTIEFVLWIPIFMGIILLTADISLVFMRQSNFRNVSYETARIVARHGMTGTEAVAFAQDRAAFGGYVPEVHVDVTDETVSVTINGLSREMAPFGILRPALGKEIVTTVTYFMEPV